MLVTSRTKEEYEEHLIKFFRLFERHGLKANPAKYFQARVPRIQRLCLKHQAVFRQSDNNTPIPIAKNSSGTLSFTGVLFLEPLPCWHRWSDWYHLCARTGEFDCRRTLFKAFEAEKR
ncbi:hypothetical protein T03_4087 [Trichinella britovi]|uniref:Retrovirus-related Pol polyprotein from transposon n=2 Tax=Trichinella TaxID=6333 RepID=A0A0V1DGW8_TRIBR|nr:hypothetical protein T05_4617 [Trichinella murrelli]KRY60582.1 hypothetical protein T03_4087 [Trichinella britovi]